MIIQYTFCVVVEWMMNACLNRNLAICVMLVCKPLNCGALERTLKCQNTQVVHFTYHERESQLCQDMSSFLEVLSTMINDGKHD